MNDKYYKFNEFKSGKINLALIVGYSGSGKSTLAYKIEEMFDNAFVLSLDMIMTERESILKDKNKYTIFSKFLLKNKGLPIGTINITCEEDRKNNIEILNRFIDFIESYAKTHINQRFIVEGIWPISFGLDPSRFKKWCVIIKNTTYIESEWRASNREVQGNKIAVGLDFIKAQNLSRLLNIRKITSNLNMWKEYFK